MLITLGRGKDYAGITSMSMLSGNCFGPNAPFIRMNRNVVRDTGNAIADDIVILARDGSSDWRDHSKINVPRTYRVLAQINNSPYSSLQNTSQIKIESDDLSYVIAA